jgi:hypothetical protein
MEYVYQCLVSEDNEIEMYVYLRKKETREINN